MADLILVTGATGEIGRELIPQLVAAGQPVRALVRDPARADFDPVVEVARADLQHPQTLDAVFAGVQKAFVLVNGPDIGALEGNAFDAARRSGVEHIVKLSALESFQGHMAGTVTARAHQESENRLRQTGVAWTMLRPAFFASNFHTYFLRRSSAGAAMFLPCGDGKEAAIDPRDIAAAAVAVLISDGHEGEDYELTGPELIGFAEVADHMSRVTGVSIEYVDVTEDDAYARLLADGFSFAFADYVVRHHFAAVKSGQMRLASGVPDLLGRPATTFAAWAERNSATLRAFLQEFAVGGQGWMLADFRNRCHRHSWQRGRTATRGRRSPSAGAGPGSAKARALPAGVDVRIGDLADPSTLPPAFAGVDKALVVVNGLNLAGLEANVPRDEARAGLLCAGLPSSQADALLMLFDGIRVGKVYPPTQTVADLLGRPARSLDDWLADLN